MTVLEETEEEVNTEWENEKKRVEELKKELPFGYDYILEALNDITMNLNTHTLFQCGAQMGSLMQVIIDKKNEE